MKSAKTDLLVPVDFKIFSLKSIDYAKRLRQLVKGKIHLLHVIESQSWWGSMFNNEELEKNAIKKLEILRKEQNLSEDTVLSVVSGKSYSGIIEYAHKINALYIIMADNYPFSDEEKMLGSTLSQVIIKADKPVISLTNTEESVFKNVVVPIDLNKSCRLQLYNSIALALKFHSKIHLVSVLFGKREISSKRTCEKIEKYSKAYRENGIDFTVQLLLKDEYFAYKSILKYCHENKVDTVLIMTHNEAASFDNYIGAFAQHIINEATMPVISINNTSASEIDSKISGTFIDPFGIFTKKPKTKKN
ncbi:MAG: universal stress protein [Bacteroidales bacterium]|nr:universal stress protein [Bacteroidales bacterium]